MQSGNGYRRSSLGNIPNVDLAPTHAIAAGKLFLYAEKMPYVSSGFGDHGVVRCNDPEDVLLCNECGTWWRMLGKHVHCHGGMTAREYKLRHGLRLSTPLVAPRLLAEIRDRTLRSGHLRPYLAGAAQVKAMNASKLLRDSGQGRDFLDAHSEQANIKGHCHEQVMASFYSLRDRLGRAPNGKEFHEFSGIDTSVIRRRFAGKTYNEFVAFCGEIPHTKSPHTRWSRAALIEILRDYYVKTGRVPTETASRRGELPSYTNFRNYFGSIKEAIRQAGLAKVHAEHCRSVKENNIRSAHAEKPVPEKTDEESANAK